MSPRDESSSMTTTARVMRDGLRVPYDSCAIATSCWSAQPRDSLTSKPEELEALGIAMGFDDQPRQELEESLPASDAPGAAGRPSR